MRFFSGLVLAMAMGVMGCGEPEPPWFQQMSGTTAELRGVSFTDANTGTVVGGEATILRTTDGGATWVAQHSGSQFGTFRAVSFTDANTGTIVGIYDRILRTTDGGTTWTRQESGTSWIDFHGVSFVDASTGTIVGTEGVILRTTDGGKTWTRQASGTTSSLFAVSFTDASIGTAVGAGVILRTTDGGASWVNQGGSGVTLSGVAFVNADHGVVVGEAGGGSPFSLVQGRILQTRSAGEMWTRRSSWTVHYLTGVSFADANNATVVGFGGIILQTTNGGDSWPPPKEIPTTASKLWDVSCVKGNHCTVVGEAGTILRYQ